MVLKTNPEFGVELALTVPYAYWLHKNNELGGVITSVGMKPFYYFCDDVEEKYDFRSLDNIDSGLSSMPNDWIHHNAGAVKGKGFEELSEDEELVEEMIDEEKTIQFNFLLIIIVLLLILLYINKTKVESNKKGKKKKKSKKGSSSLMLFLVLAASIFSLNSFTVYAEEDKGIAIMPAATTEEANRSWFVYELEPGAEINDQANIINLTGRTVTAKVYAVDATTTSTGGFALESYDTEGTGIGAWITLDTQEVELEPGEVKTVDFTLNAPKDIEVGEHAGGLVVTELKAEDKESKTGYAIGTAVGARVYLTVPGEIFNSIAMGEELSFNVLNKTFFVDLVNKGNVRFSPSFIIDIKNIFGNIIETIEVPMVYEILPGKAVEVPILWENARAGLWEADVKIFYAGKEYIQTLKFNIYPSTNTLVMFFSILVITLIVIIILVKRKKKFIGAA